MMGRFAVVVLVLAMMGCSPGDPATSRLDVGTECVLVSPFEPDESAHIPGKVLLRTGEGWDRVEGTGHVAVPTGTRCVVLDDVEPMGIGPHRLVRVAVDCEAYAGEGGASRKGLRPVR